MSVLRVFPGALALLIAVTACNATVLEVSKEHPAHPGAPVAAPVSTSRALADDFDALEYEGVANAGSHEHGQHGAHGQHGQHGGAPAAPAGDGAKDAGPAGHAGHDHPEAP